LLNKYTSNATKARKQRQKNHYVIGRAHLLPAVGPLWSETQTVKKGNESQFECLKYNKN